MSPSDSLQPVEGGPVEPTHVRKRNGGRRWLVNLGIAGAVLGLAAGVAGFLAWIFGAGEAKANLATKPDLTAAIIEHDATGHASLREKVQANQERLSVGEASTRLALDAIAKEMGRMADEQKRTSEALDRLRERIPPRAYPALRRRE